MLSVAVIGVSGYIGSRLLAKLDGTDCVSRIIGIDLKQPAFSSSKLKFYRHDVLEPFNDIFRENKIDSAINLAFVLKPNHNKTRTHRIDIDGNLNFLKACKHSNVDHILYLSSHTVYGAHSDNPLYLDEDSPLRPLLNFQYSRDKAETENILGNFKISNEHIHVTILRSCPVIGPNAANSIVALMFKPPAMIAVRGYNPRMQFVHEEDLAELITQFLDRRKDGIFNVAGDGELRYSEIADIVGKKMFKLPERLLRVLMGVSWVYTYKATPPQVV